MKNFRVEYYDEKSKKMKVIFVDALDLNDLKSKCKYKSMSVCETKEYKLADIRSPSRRGVN